MLLSIVTPTYNRATYLKKKLKQMRSLRFHFNEFEWIIVVEKKDKSTIKFTKTIKERFVKVLIGEYGSADKAFTVGVFEANGKYINFHGDDDFFYMKQSKFLNKNLFINKYEWLIFKGNYINDKFLIVRKSMTAIKNFLLNNFGIIDLSIINFIMTPSVFIRKDVCIKHGCFGKSKKPGSDYILWMKLNKEYKPKIYNQSLTLSMVTKETTTGKFNLKKYRLISKKMFENNKHGILGKFLIFNSIIIIIIYNFVFKKIFNK